MVTPLAEEELDENETNAADRVAWLSLLRRSMNAAMITAGTKRFDAISPRCNSTAKVIMADVGRPFIELCSSSLDGVECDVDVSVMCDDVFDSSSPT